MKDQFLRDVENLNTHVSPEDFRKEIIKAFKEKDEQRIIDIKNSWCKITKEEYVINNLRCAANYADIPTIGSGEFTGACTAMLARKTMGPISEFCKKILDSLVAAN